MTAEMTLSQARHVLLVLAALAESRRKHYTRQQFPRGSVRPGWTLTNTHVQLLGKPVTLLKHSEQGRPKISEWPDRSFQVQAQKPVNTSPGHTRLRHSLSKLWSFLIS
jgi:hypothetical protein